jgi:hypothetical protein
MDARNHYNDPIDNSRDNKHQVHLSALIDQSMMSGLDTSLPQLNTLEVKN